MRRDGLLRLKFTIHDSKHRIYDLAPIECASRPPRARLERERETTSGQVYQILVAKKMFRLETFTHLYVRAERKLFAVVYSKMARINRFLIIDEEKKERARMNRRFFLVEKRINVSNEANRGDFWSKLV